MDILTIILIIFIIVFLIGNILLSYVFSKQKRMFNFQSYDAKIDILNSKIDVLNKRISLLEEDKKNIFENNINFKKKVILKEKD